MLDPKSSAESAADNCVDCARMALCVFAELTQIGGANAVADAEGVAAVSPELFKCLMRLLDIDGVAVGPVVREAFAAYSRQHQQQGRSVPDPIAMLHDIHRMATGMHGADGTERVAAIIAYFLGHGWLVDGSMNPFES